jgi:phosphate/sulfate permease
MLIVVLVLAVTFGLVNGIHDAGNAIAAPVTTRPCAHWLP